MGSVPVLAVVHAVMGAAEAASYSAFELVADRPYDASAALESVASPTKECVNGHDPYGYTYRLLCSPRKESESDQIRVTDKDVA